MQIPRQSRHLIHRLAQPNLGAQADPTDYHAELVLTSPPLTPFSGDSLYGHGHDLLCPVARAREAPETTAGL